MKKLVIITLVLVLTSGVSFAAGGKNHGTKGKGNTSTGTSSQGTSTQSQTGR